MMTMGVTLPPQNASVGGEGLIRTVSEAWWSSVPRARQHYLQSSLREGISARRS